MSVAGVRIFVAVLVFVGRFLRLADVLVRGPRAARVLVPVRAEASEDVAVADAHPHDFLFRPTGRAEQIVPDDGFEELADLDAVRGGVGGVFFADGLESPGGAIPVRPGLLQDGIHEAEVDSPQNAFVPFAGLGHRPGGEVPLAVEIDEAFPGHAADEQDPADAPCAFARIIQEQHGIARCKRPEQEVRVAVVQLPRAIPRGGNPPRLWFRANAGFVLVELHVHGSCGVSKCHSPFLAPSRRSKPAFDLSAAMMRCACRGLTPIFSTLFATAFATTFLPSSQRQKRPEPSPRHKHAPVSRVAPFRNMNRIHQS